MVEAYTVGVLATFYDQAIVVQESGLSDWLMFSLKTVRFLFDVKVKTLNSLG